MLRARLAIKIFLVILAVLIMGFGAATILTIRRESAMLVEQEKLAARRMTATLIASIEGAMLQERPDVTRTVIDELRANSPVEQFGIYRWNGIEAFTDLTTVEEVNRTAGLPAEVLANIRKRARPAGTAIREPLFERALATLTTQEALVNDHGRRLFVLAHPIRNQERCQGCHGTDHAVRAVVRVATSMEPVFAEVRRHRNRQILVGVATIVAAGAVLGVAMRHVVVRPIEELARAARRIGEGDFAVQAPAAQHDEIGALGVAFNEMTARLARAHADLEGKNAQLETALRSLQESRQRLELLEQLKGELSKFVPEAVKRLLEDNPNATELEKKAVDVSVLFLDIAGYTTLSEQLETRKLNQLVQTYFSAFLEIIHSYHGDVSETAGDGLMVIFQSERGGADHALNATRAAFAIRQRTASLNDDYGGVFPPIQVHMGINTGEALVGATKLGSASGQRWTFTATGPTTNVAARFAASAPAGDIVVGAATADRIRQHFVLESLGERTFKNVSQPLAVFRVIPPGVYAKIV